MLARRNNHRKEAKAKKPIVRNEMAFGQISRSSRPKAGGRLKSRRKLSIGFSDLSVPIHLLPEQIFTETDARYSTVADASVGQTDGLK